MKKIIALALSALLLIGAAVVGTVAFLTDTDQAVNVMTSGNIDIEQYEMQRDKNGDLVDFKNSDMYPAFTVDSEKSWGECVKDFSVNGKTYSFWDPEQVKNVKDNIVYVENTGKNAAYVRTFFAFENPFGKDFAEKVVLNWSSAVTAKALGNATIDSTTYAIYVVTYEKAIAPGAFSAPSLLQFAFAEKADNEDMKAIDGSLEVLAFTQAVQTEGFSNEDDAAATALNRAFTSAHPWTLDNAPGAVVGSYAGLVKAVADANVKKISVVSNIVLENDVALKVGQYLEIAPGMKVSIDLAGKTLTGSSHKDVGPVIKNKGILTITGGTIKSTAANGGSAVQNGGTLLVQDVTLNGAPNADGSWPSYTVNNTGVMTVNNSKITSYHGAVASYNDGALLTLNNTEIDMTGIPGFTNHAIYTYSNGKVVVNSGKIVNNAADQNSTGGSVINGHVEIYGGTFSGRIENYYGTPVIVGGTFSVDPSKYATGSAVTKNADDTWTVAPHVASDLNGLRENLNGGKNVIFSDDVTGDAVKGGYSVAGAVVKGNVLDGNGNTLTVNNANGTWDCAVAATGGTIKNLTVSGAFRGILTGGIETDLYIENVVFDGVVYTFQADGETGACADYGVYISNSTLNGWTSFSNMFKEVIFTKCSFGEGSGYAFCRPYNASVFENCVFEEGFEFDTSKTSDITFINCYYGETLITAENAASLGLFYNGLNGITIK